MRHQPLGRREAQFAVPDLIGHGAQVGALGVQQHDEVMPIAFLIAQKQIFAMRSIDAVPVPFGLIDGRHRRMLMPLVRNSKLRETRGDGRFGIGRHRKEV